MPSVRDVAKEGRARGPGDHILPALPASLRPVGAGATKPSLPSTLLRPAITAGWESMRCLLVRSTRR
jgi:hypothetical protein